MQQAVPLLQNPTPAENAVFAVILVSFGVAWFIGFSAQENIRRHLPGYLREVRIYGPVVDRYAFAPTTPHYLQARYLLAHGLFILPCAGGIALCLMISNGKALCVCLGFLALSVFNFGRSWRRYAGRRVAD